MGIADDHINVAETGGVASACWVCGRPTLWVELNFEAYLCPGKCTDLKWEEYAVINLLTCIEEVGEPDAI